MMALIILNLAHVLNFEQMLWIRGRLIAWPSHYLASTATRTLTTKSWHLPSTTYSKTNKTARWMKKILQWTLILRNSWHRSCTRCYFQVRGRWRLGVQISPWTVAQSVHLATASNGMSVPGMGTENIVVATTPLHRQRCV